MVSNLGCSKNEKKTVLKLIKKIRKNKNGQIADKTVIKAPKNGDKNEHHSLMIWEKVAPKKPKTVKESFLWEILHPRREKRFQRYVPPSKLSLPGHAESYNPPAEYLFDNEERREWKQNPTERVLNFIPRKISAMRLIPKYKKLISELNERSKEIYAMPRILKKKRKLEEETEIVPKIDRTKMRPFPTKLGACFLGHKGRVYTLSLTSCGQWLATGDEDSVRVWEVETGKCVMVKNFPAYTKVAKVLFHPKTTILAVLITSLSESSSSLFVFTNPTKAMEENEFSKNKIKSNLTIKSKKKKILKIFGMAAVLDKEKQTLELKIDATSEYFSWHPRGSHLVMITRTKPYLFVLKIPFDKINLIEELSVQFPLENLKKIPTSAFFSKTRKLFFVVFDKVSKVYNLIENEEYKLLKGGRYQFTAAAASPSGEQFVAGTLEGDLLYYDFEMETTPLRFKCHNKGIRSISFHPKFPLFATASADGELHIFHSKVFDDFVSEPEIIPVNYFQPNGKGRHGAEKGLLDCVFHPFQPWVFSCGSNNVVQMYID